jgi:hypothetical protein
MALSVLLVTPSNLFSVRLGIVCSSCYPFKRFLSVAMALSVLLVTPSNVSSFLFAMALSVLLVTPSNFSYLSADLQMIYKWNLIILNLENRFLYYQK